MESGLYDKAADEIVRRYGLVKAEIVRRNKGKKPFRMKPVSKEDRIADYLSTDERVKESLRQQFPEYTQYEQEIQKEMEGLNG